MTGRDGKQLNKVNKVRSLSLSLILPSLSLSLSYPLSHSLSRLSEENINTGNKVTAIFYW